MFLKTNGSGLESGSLIQLLKTVNVTKGMQTTITEGSNVRQQLPVEHTTITWALMFHRL